ncbi:MAG: hypothetical protein H6710_00785 [Myxococcales bacterium]|nr:hypothetical protein [Myxococcales bacterium]
MSVAAILSLGTFFLGAPAGPADAAASASAPATSTPEVAEVPDEEAPPSPHTRGLGVDVESVAHQAAAGFSGDGRWQVGASAGYPWWGARAQLGVGHGLSTAVELQSALARRWRPAIGLTSLWLDRPRVRISGELLLGWLFQVGELARRGPNAELRLRLALRLRRAAPYLMLGSQHTLLASRTTIEAASGTTVRWSARGEWTGWATLGVVAAVSRKWGIDLAADLTWVDAPATAAIPGAHIGLVYGGLWR